MYQFKLFACLLVSSFLLGFSYSEPQCQRINKTISDLHIQCGYNLTARFEYDQHFDSASRAIGSLKSVLKNCSAFVNIMMCSLFLPRCTEDIKGPYLPCRGVCHDYANDCKDIIFKRGLEWTVAMCDILPVTDNPQTTKGYRERCFTPPNYRDSGKTYKHNCSDIVIDDCRGIPGYTKTVVSEKTQSRYQNYIKSKIKHDHEGDNCSSLRKEIVCAENLPACIDGTTAFLCRDNCLSFFDKCLSPFFYGSDMCMEFPRREVTGKESPICKQTHWPRSENWQLPEITNTPTPTPGISTTREPGVKTGDSSTQEGGAKTGVFTTQGPVVKTDEVPSPVPGIRGHHKAKKSGSNKLLVGLVVTFVFILLIALAVVGFIWYRRKKSRQFDYQKQVLYCDDKAEEFEIFT